MLSSLVYLTFPLVARIESRYLKPNSLRTTSQVFDDKPCAWGMRILKFNSSQQVVGAKKLQVNIPFLDAIFEIPSYTNFLKEILSNTRKLQENAMASLTKGV